MSSSRARHIPQLLDLHAEDLAFLWGQRRRALDSPEHTLRDFAQLSERIEAHIQGLLVAPPSALQQRFESVVGQDVVDRDDVLASAVAALRSGDASVARRVIVEFSRAGGAVLDGLRDAMGLAPAAVVADELRNALAHARPATAASAAAALANLRLLSSDAPGLARLLLDDDEAASALAWGAVAHADRPGQAVASAPRPYREALARKAPAVRHAVWAGAAWGGHFNALAALREAVRAGDPVAVHWLCVLGTADDAQLIGKTVMAWPEAGARCAALARFGHPAVLPTLVRWMEDADPVQAHAAGEAFSRITGADVQGERRTLPVAAQADDFEREMAPSVWIPDPAKAKRALERDGTAWNSGTRWCRGRQTDAASIDADTLAALDLQARWEAAARAALGGRRLSTPPPIVL